MWISSLFIIAWKLLLTIKIPYMNACSKVLPHSVSQSVSYSFSIVILILNGSAMFVIARNKHEEIFSTANFETLWSHQCSECQNTCVCATVWLARIYMRKTYELEFTNTCLFWHSQTLKTLKCLKFHRWLASMYEVFVPYFSTHLANRSIWHFQMLIKIVTHGVFGISSFHEDHKSIKFANAMH